MNTLPSFETYGNYSSSNYGAHALRFDLPNITIYFSYKTPVAFTYKGKTTVRANDWSNTTGKHLNAIDGGDKKSRINGERFEQELAQITGGNND